MNKSFVFIIAVSLMLGMLSACTSVKAYQKMYLNDQDMQLSDSALEGFEGGFQSYREGVAGGNGGKTGGGCGCN